MQSGQRPLLTCGTGESNDSTPCEAHARAGAGAVRSSDRLDRVARTDNAALEIALAKLWQVTNLESLANQDPPQFLIGSSTVRRSHQPVNVLESSASGEPLDEAGQCRQRAFTTTIDVGEIDDQSVASSLALCQDVGRAHSDDERTTDEYELIEFVHWQIHKLFRRVTFDPNHARSSAVYLSPAPR